MLFGRCRIWLLFKTGVGDFSKSAVGTRDVTAWRLEMVPVFLKWINITSVATPMESKKIGDTPVNEYHEGVWRTAFRAK